MEAMGAYLEEEWESLSRMFFTEEADFMAHLHGHDESTNSFSFGTSSTVWPIDEAYNMNNVGVDESLFHSSDTFNTDFHYFSQESSNSSGSCNNIFFPSQENHYFSDSNHIHETNYTLESTDFCARDDDNYLPLPIIPDNVIQDTLSLKEEIRSENLGPGKELQLKRREKNNDSSETPKKKSRVSRDAQKGKKKAASSRKNQKLITLNGSDEEEEETNAGTNGQSSSCCSSEEDFNASRELNNGGSTSDSKGSTALNSNGKTRASRGAATDPQSLYARKRRERINERLRILQNLVPNGTKVDISTMLEEAVHYVKFLQLQIKLLSSDELWMFAPIAYNGMDMGLYHKISPTL